MKGSLAWEMHYKPAAEFVSSAYQDGKGRLTKICYILPDAAVLHETSIKIVALACTSQC